MDFYQSISKYYNEIFPLNPMMLEFLSSDLKNSSKILDVACATGQYSNQLSLNGHEVIGIDLDKEMITLAKQHNPSIDFLSMNMLNIDSFTGRFDMIFCIGNSLVHLESLEQVELFLQKAYQQLNSDGLLKIQIIDYENIINNSIDSLPLIKTKQLEFIRTYQLTENNRYVLFNTKLVTKDLTISNQVKLLTVTKNEMELLLEKAGFKNINFFGGPNKQKRSNSSLPLVISASKA